MLNGPRGGIPHRGPFYSRWDEYFAFHQLRIGTDFGISWGFSKKFIEF